MLKQLFSSFQVWDVKLPLCVLPHCALRDDVIKHGVHARIAQVLGWSMECAARGIGPAVREDGLPFTSAFRHSLANRELAGGFKLAYLGFKADYKARCEAHRFDRYYLCDFICEACMAQKAKRNMTCPFTDFSAQAPYRLTGIGHETYLRTAACPSPWVAMPGFHLHNVFRDLMHTLYLGTLHTLIPSCVVLWIRFDVLGDGSLADKLQRFSRDMKQKCREHGPLAISKCRKIVDSACSGPRVTVPISHDPQDTAECHQLHT